MARRTRGRVVSAPRRQTTWISSADQGYVTISAGAKTLIQSFDPQAAGLMAPTIVRTRGRLAVKSTQAAADAEVVGAVGMCVISDQAFAAGAGSIPGPFTDSGWGGWLAWEAVMISLQFVDGTGVFIDDRAFEFDSKAMRKVSSD